MAQLVDFGITTKSEDQNLCRRKEDFICNSYINDKGPDGIYQYFEKHCLGRDSCVIDHIDQFVKRTGDAQRLLACVDPESRVFFQYYCEQTEQQIQTKIKDAREIAII